MAAMLSNADQVPLSNQQDYMEIELSIHARNLKKVGPLTVPIVSSSSSSPPSSCSDPTLRPPPQNLTPHVHSLTSCLIRTLSGECGPAAGVKLVIRGPWQWDCGFRVGSSPVPILLSYPRPPYHPIFPPSLPHLSSPPRPHPPSPPKPASCTCPNPRRPPPQPQPRAEAPAF